MKSLLTFIFFSYAIFASAQSVKAKVYAVHDGDSFKVLVEGETVKKWVRIQGVDCPEVYSPYVSKRQPYGKQAGDSLRALIKHRTIDIEPIGTDAYGRTVVMAGMYNSPDSAKYINLTEYIIEKGWGWYTIDSIMTPNYITALMNAQQSAEATKLGLWGMPGPKTRPSAWRRLYRNVPATSNQ